MFGPGGLNITGVQISHDSPQAMGKVSATCFSLLSLTTYSITVDNKKSTLVVVVCPLTALMEDQVTSYSAKGVKCAIVKVTVLHPLLSSKACTR